MSSATTKLPLGGVQVRVEHDERGQPFLNHDDLQLSQQSGRAPSFQEVKAVARFFAEELKKGSAQ